ncbi:MAG TPA: MFS transporter [Opitutaceae bacterium]|nr:MFS transporter [Opitutaceae bacterium]
MRRARTIPRLRWWIAVLLFGAAVLNYVDRQTLSALAPTIQRDLGMNDRDYANIVNLFLFAYTIAYLISGRLSDALGTRAGMTLFVCWWSISNALTAFASDVRSLGMFRFALGLGEAGVWPAASKAVSEWFPSRERALAIGFYTMGSTIGATIAPYLVIPLAAFPFAQKLPWIAHAFGEGAGWRMAFVLTGLAGLVWLVPWWLIYRHPARSSLIREDEKKLILEDSAESRGDVASADGGTAVPETSWTWREVFSSRVVWLLLLARLITDPVWYFFQFWFAKYLHTVRGLEQDQLTITWVIYAAAAVGSLAGGWLSGWRIRRGATPALGRLQVMLGCALLLPLAPLIASAPSLFAAMAAATVVVAASLAWLINLTALIVDLIPRHSLGSVFGVVAAGSTCGGLVMNTLVAAMVTNQAARPSGFLDQAIHSVFGTLLSAVQGQGYGRWFLWMAFLHPVAWVLLRSGKLLRAPRGSLN